MDDYEMALQLVKSIQDAENNDQDDLADELRADLAGINERLVADGWAAVEA